MKKEYRVVWKWSAYPAFDCENNPITVNPRPKMKRYSTRRGVERFMLLLGPEPWKYFGANPDDYVCCSGRECGCGGLTYREQAEGKRFAEIEYIRLEEREVGEWVKH
jgi:hypothetical protein